MHTLPLLTGPSSLGQCPFWHRLLRGWIHTCLNHVSTWSHIAWSGSVILQSILLALVSSMPERVFGRFLFLWTVAWEVLRSWRLLKSLQREPRFSPYLWCFTSLLPRMVSLYRIIKEPLIFIEVITRLGFRHSWSCAKSPCWFLLILEWLVFAVIDGSW